MIIWIYKTTLLTIKSGELLYYEQLCMFLLLEKK